MRVLLSMSVLLLASQAGAACDTSGRYLNGAAPLAKALKVECGRDYTDYMKAVKNLPAGVHTALYGMQGNPGVAMNQVLGDVRRLGYTMTKASYGKDSLDTVMTWTKGKQVLVLNFVNNGGKNFFIETGR
jgi:hypothetical protein